MGGYEVIERARDAIGEYVCAHHGTMPNLLRMSHEQYQALNAWCEEEEQRWKPHFINPIEVNRLLGMHIETHSGPLEVTFDPALVEA